MNKITPIISEIESDYQTLGFISETSLWCLKQEIRAYGKEKGLDSIEVKGGNKQ